MRTLVVNAFRLPGRRTAAGRHIERLVSEWSRAELPFDRVILYSGRPATLPELGDEGVIQFRSFGGMLPALAWEQAALPIAARGAAALFCPSYTAPLMHSGPLVLANHGIYERLPDEFPLLQRIRSTPLHRASARRASRVIANSRQTKSDIVEFFKVPEQKVDVVYPAANEIFFRSHPARDVDSAVERVFGRRAPYLIFVGKLSRRRNVPNLIEAFSIVHRAHPDHRLLIVGPNTSNVPITELSSRYGVANSVTYLAHLEQDELALLYTGADAFVLPTTYEGISYTMFEAMASGTAVLTVDHPTVAEGQDGVLTVPTPSVADLAWGLNRILGEEGFRDVVAERGRVQARRFSWKRSAHETMEILDRAALAQDAGG